MRHVRTAETCLAAGLLACLLLALAAPRNPVAAAEAWLAAYVFWLGLPLGALFLTLVFALIGTRWSADLRPVVASMARSLPLLTALAIPILVGAGHLYPWGATGGDGWLGLSLFDLRAVAYLALWNGTAFAAHRFGSPDGSLPPAIAWLGLIVLSATVSLAAFDWLMALEPGWTSTVFGLLVTTDWVLSALACAVAIGAIVATGPGTPDRLDASARLLLALVMLWAYLSAVQLIVIWESDLATETSWYLARMAGGWRVVALSIVALEFVVPFLLLLWQPLRRSSRAVLSAATAVIVGRLLETWWLTIPDLPRPFGWLEPVAVVAIGGCVLFVIARGLGFGSAPPLRLSHERR